MARDSTIETDPRPDLSLWMLAELIRRRFWVLFAVATGFVVAFGVIAFTMRPVYRAQAVLSPVSMAMQPGMNGMAGLAAVMDLDLGLAGGPSPRIAQALAVARSREFVERFMTDFQMLPILFAERWNEAGKRWRSGERPTPGEALERFHEVAQFAEDKKRQMYFVQVEWHDAVLAATWANALVERLNSTMRQRALARTAETIRQLEAELADTANVEVRNRVARLIEVQINERMIATVTPEYVFTVVDRATPPDGRDRLRPRRGLMLMSGGLVGGFVGLAAILLLEAARRARGRARTLHA